MGSICINGKKNPKSNRKIPTKEEIEMLKVFKYHRNNPNQINYFGEQEKEEIDKFLKNEAKNKMSSKISRKIKCQEIEVLGTGAFGQVVKGLDKANNLYMAVKKIKIRSFPSNKDELEMLGREIQVLSDLKHPNIITYYGSKIDSGYQNIYMELMDLGSIEDYLKMNDCFPVGIVANFTEKILLGLDYLHKHSIIHRDIKTANILLNSNGEVKLSDFGCAKYITAGVNSMAGTPGYMAPEVS